MKDIREASENYLEAILLLEKKDPSNQVRSIDLANHLGVSRPSVNKAIGVLREAGMVIQQPYGAISLTEQGRTRAVEVARRHRVLKKFLTDVLGVREEIAEGDACRMEHVVSADTMQSWTDYLETVLAEREDCL